MVLGLVGMCFLLGPAIPSLMAQAAPNPAGGFVGLPADQVLMDPNNKKLLTDKIKKLPADAGVSVADIDLLPWDERGMRVNIAKMNQVMLKVKK